MYVVPADLAASRSPLASASARPISALKITRPAVVTSSSSPQRYSIVVLQDDLLRAERELDLLLVAKPHWGEDRKPS